MLQILTALTLRDFWLEDILPFSCCPMFMLPRNPFDEWPKWWTMTDAPINGSTRVSGAMEPLYWSPASPIFKMTEAEAKKLPQRVVWFGCTEHIPTEVLKFIEPEIQNMPFVFMSNFEVDGELKELLRRMVEMVNESTPEDAWDGRKMAQLLDLHEECLAAFNACVADAKH